MTKYVFVILWINTMVEWFCNLRVVRQEVWHIEVLCENLLLRIIKVLAPFNIDTFAFATWGGDFWLFVRTYGFGQTTDVYRVQPNGVMTMFAQNTGMDVVGAGVSTCAPSE